MTRPLRVLVVDDNPDDIELLRLTFTRAGAGAVVEEAGSTEAAAQRLRGGGPRPDLVLLDWKMPGMGGPEFLRGVRADPRGLGLPVVVFSSSDDPADVRAAFLAGATAYFSKPPGFAEYESLVHDLQAFWGRSAPFPK